MFYSFVIRLRTFICTHIVFQHLRNFDILNFAFASIEIVEYIDMNVEFMVHIATT